MSMNLQHWGAARYKHATGMNMLCTVLSDTLDPKEWESLVCAVVFSPRGALFAALAVTGKFKSLPVTA